MTTVKQVIEDLKQLNPNRKVYVSGWQFDAPVRDYNGVQSFAKCVIICGGPIVPKIDTRQGNEHHRK